nr:unnamed protein product [Callosobruchus analis]
MIAGKVIVSLETTYKFIGTIDSFIFTVSLNTPTIFKEELMGLPVSNMALTVMLHKLSSATNSKVIGNWYECSINELSLSIVEIIELVPGVEEFWLSLTLDLDDFIGQSGAL